MALTLPYPDLDFVPLDILTAEEMNEIVANYTFIASQFPIGAGALDFANLYLEADPIAASITCPRDVLTTIQTLDLPVGQWRVSYLMRGYTSTSGNSGLMVSGGIYEGDATDYEIVTNFASTGDTIRGEVTGEATITVTSPTTIASRVRPYGKPLDVSANAYLCADRVGV